MLINLESLLCAGVRLSHRPSQLSHEATLHHEPLHDLYYVYDPEGEGETEHERLDKAWAAFQRATGLEAL